MIDIAGTFKAHDSVKKRSSKDAYFLVQVCMITGATCIGVMEDLTTTSVILALKRTASRYGWPKYLLADNQSSFKTLDGLAVSFTDLQGKLWKDQKLILDFSTPLAHHEHGRVESKVKALKDFLYKSRELKRKHSYVEWESIALDVAAVINNLPICHNQDDKQIEDTLGLVTPNMLLIGRNNTRCPTGYVSFEINPVKALNNIQEMNDRMLDLLGQFVHRFVPGKILSDGDQPDLGDIVLFTMKEAIRSRNIGYRYGKVIEVNVDGRVNKTRIKYRNADEVVFREVIRNVKDLILILGSGDIDFNTQEHYLQSVIQKRYLRTHTLCSDLFHPHNLQL